MYRRTGVYLLLLFVILTLFLLWLPVRYFTGYRVTADQVSKIYVPCGSTIGILAENFDPAVDRPNERVECTARARGRMVYVIVFSGPLLILGLYAVLRGRGRPEPLRR